MKQSVDNHIIIIAEAGVNHNGSLARALEMVKAAADAGADYVKFQTFNAENLVNRTAEKAEYQKENCGGGESQWDMLKKLELTAGDFAAIKCACDDAGIGFMSTPFDLASIELLDTLGQDFWKIPSGEITNLPYLRSIGRLHGNVIMSTGMCDMTDVTAAVDALESAGTPRESIVLLHCNTQYPTPMHDVNLLAMRALRVVGCGAVGFSDHTVGIEVPIAAAAMGAKVVEKHFTLDRSLPGPDHKASLEPTELSDMVKAIRNIELALGNGEKLVTDSERPNLAVARKSIVASRRIAKGERFTDDNLTSKRPGTGLSPMMWDSVVGTAAKRDFLPDEQIEI